MSQRELLERGPLGEALHSIRKSKGLTHSQVAARIKSTYSDGKAYGRVERGQQHPERDDLIDILIRGFRLSDANEIDRVLALGGYAGLTSDEREYLKIAEDIATSTPLSRLTIPSSTWIKVALFDNWSVGAIGAVAASSIASFIVASHWCGADAAFAWLTSTLYALLFPNSLYLEGAFQPDRRPLRSAATFSFCFVQVTSVIALAFDVRLRSPGFPIGLSVALVILVLAGIAQWQLVRSALAATAVVPASFTAHTAQAAHLKNTVYYLLVAVGFWAPTLHAVAALRSSGVSRNVRSVSFNSLLIGPDVVTMTPGWLIVIVLLMLVYFFPLGGHMVDRVMQTSRRNTYVNLIYFRLLGMFSLAVMCLGWFAYWLSSFKVAI